MTKSKARLERSLDAIVEKAEFCSNLAKDQRATADKQYQSAHKLEKLSEALTEDVAEIKNEVEAEEKVSPRSRGVEPSKSAH
jgi:hypothetical protein